MKALFTYLLCLFLISCNLSCDKVNQKKEQLLDKLFPTFNSELSDTPANKRRFKEFLKVKLSDDVKNIYCFDDVIGIDSDYMFSFNCNEETAQKIIEVHNFEIDTTNSDNAFNIQHDFHWWDKQRIVELQKYSWTNGKNYNKYFWYDSKQEKAYFFDFDL